MPCAQRIFLQEAAVACSRISSSDTSQCSPSSSRNLAAGHCGPASKRDGCPDPCISIAEISEISTSPHGPAAWIASQRASLARIFRALEAAMVSKAHGAASSGAAVGAGHERNRWWLLAANADGLRQLEQERRERKQWGWFGHGDKEVADADSEHGNLERHDGCHDVGNGQEEVAHLDGVRDDGVKECSAGDDDHRDSPGWLEKTSRAQERPKDAADTMRQRLQIAVQRGGVSETTAATIQTAAGYTGTYHWSPPDAGICGVVDGFSAEMVGVSKSARIKSCGNGQVPIAAAAAWLRLSA